MAIPPALCRAASPSRAVCPSRAPSPAMQPEGGRTAARRASGCFGKRQRPSGTLTELPPDGRKGELRCVPGGQGRERGKGAKETRASRGKKEAKTQRESEGARE